MRPTNPRNPGAGGVLLGVGGAALAVLGLSAPADDAFEPYRESLPGSQLSFDLVPIPGGEFEMGSEDGDPDAQPPHRVRVSDFWIARHEVTWDEYDLFLADEPDPAQADGVTRPTPPYADPAFGFSRGRQPVLSITHHSAMTYTDWLSELTGRRYRLPTEAEWEHVCRGGGDEPPVAERAWYFDNSDGRPQPVAGLPPDAWGIHDLLGNVAEWVLDGYDPEAYAGRAGAVAQDPLVPPSDQPYPHVVRGGSWDDDVEDLSCSARRSSRPAWSQRDPQRPQSIWWHTDATFVGFRVVRPREAGESHEIESGGS